MLKHNTSMKTFSFFFFFNDTATTEIYTLSLHDALPILAHALTDDPLVAGKAGAGDVERRQESGAGDRKSTRLNSSHDQISYAVFCLKKKKIQKVIVHLAVQDLLHLLVVDA